jgi:hypothetical protein
MSKRSTERMKKLLRMGHGVSLKPVDRPWVRMTLGAAQITADAEALWLTLLPNAGDRYADAQIDDYGGTRFVWRPPVCLTVEARFSHPANSMVGTAGFGFWNGAAMPGALIGPPSAVWFFFASLPSRIVLSPEGPGRGWLAMVWRSPASPRLRVPGWFQRGLSRLLKAPPLAHIALSLGARWMAVSQHPLGIDLTAWHRYVLRWERHQVVFEVDEEEVHRALIAPAGPLGFVAWIDNQFLTLDPATGLSAGLLPVPAAQSLALRWVEIELG